MAVSASMNADHLRFTALVRAYSSDLFRYALWLCGNRAVAEDLVQESFARAWRALDSLQDERAAKGWLITILRRENARRFERLQPLLVHDDEVVLVDDHGPHAETQQENEWLRRRIAALPLEYREPLVLQVLLGYSGDEIAALLELNLNTVNTRLFRARAQLREMLEGDARVGGHNGRA